MPATNDGTRDPEELRDQKPTPDDDLATAEAKSGTIERALDRPASRPRHRTLGRMTRVRDHGIGVDPKDRARLFDRSYQAHRGRSGMGLGLYITRQIVEKHGGTVYAEFPEDGGTRFVVSLPLA